MKNTERTGLTFQEQNDMADFLEMAVEHAEQTGWIAWPSSDFAWAYEFLIAALYDGKVSVAGKVMQ